MTKQRNASIDCLRLICMMMVVSLHYFGWGGGINSSPETTKTNFVIASGICVFCRVSVNCFYMITGYFMKPTEAMINGKWILTSELKQYKKMWFYSVTVFLICCACGLTVFSVKDLIASVLPIMSNEWWFMTIFAFLLCIKPFVEKR